MAVPTIFFDLGDTLVFDNAGTQVRFDDALDALQVLRNQGVVQQFQPGLSVRPTD